MRYAAVFIVVSMAAVLLTWGCGDDGGSPQSVALRITGLSASPDTVDPAGFSTITCTTAGAGGDSLAFTWDAGAGTISDSGATVTWSGPIEAGTYTVSVTVEDESGKTDSDSVQVEVREGTLLVITSNDLVAVDMSGNSFVLTPTTRDEVEVVGTRIFLAPGTIQEISHSGVQIGETPVPPEAPSRVTGFAAFYGGFVFMENWGDTLTIFSFGGDLIENVIMPEASSVNQPMRGTVVGDAMIIAETGARKLVKLDLTTREASIFKDLSVLGTWLMDIDHANGVYYIPQYDDVFAFTEQGAPQNLFHVGSGFMLRLAVVGRYVYVTDRDAGTIYKVDVTTGERETFVEGLFRPVDIEFLPVALQAP
jgi:hypothetical protein